MLVPPHRVTVRQSANLVLEHLLVDAKVGVRVRVVVGGGHSLRMVRAGQRGSDSERARATYGNSGGGRSRGGGGVNLHRHGDAASVRKGRSVRMLFGGGGELVAVVRKAQGVADIQRRIPAARCTAVLHPFTRNLGAGKQTILLRLRSKLS